MSGGRHRAAERLAARLAALHAAAHDDRLRTRLPGLLAELRAGRGPWAADLETAADGLDRLRLRDALGRWAAALYRAGRDPRGLAAAARRVLDALPPVDRRLRHLVLTTASLSELPRALVGQVLRRLNRQGRRLLAGDPHAGLIAIAVRDLMDRRVAGGRLARTALATVAGTVGGFLFGRMLARALPGKKLHETTTAAAIATVAMPLGAVQARPPAAPSRRRRRRRRRAV